MQESKSKKKTSAALRQQTFSVSSEGKALGNATVYVSTRQSRADHVSAKRYDSRLSRNKKASRGIPNWPICVSEAAPEKALIQSFKLLYFGNTSRIYGVFCHPSSTFLLLSLVELCFNEHR